MPISFSRYKSTFIHVLREGFILLSNNNKKIANCSPNTKEKSYIIICIVFLFFFLFNGMALAYSHFGILILLRCLVNPKSTIAPQTEYELKVKTKIRNLCGI